MDYFIGVDLGQLTDFTAAAVIRRSLAVRPDGLPERSSAGCPLYRFDMVALRRYQLGTSYAQIVAHIVAQATRPELRPRPRLVIDSTGVGVAVVEMFRTALRGVDDVECHAITITAGRSWSITGRGAWNVAKIELVGAIREALESGRLKMPKTMENAELLKKELLDFRVKITAAANETFNAREGAHDDLVLATALPIWLANQRVMEMSTDLATPMIRRESDAVSAESTKIEAEERAALELERRAELVDAAKRNEEFMSIDNEHWWS